ncbi:hypothetical protein D9C73_013414 [Collichthys lucidus]|uniref:Uncharacterized protein n=1 Tax=Collichthys lucidus TaxID=240159 RepID=A0A4U5UYH3_COLLU|nr:hypothetical protein D9C73_013414 [Collichthys lucidus]
MESICVVDNIGPLASLARDICPFPNYNPNPLFVNMLSPNSSLHLRKHYMEVQSSLTPQQLEDFTQGLRRTFGKEGKVTLGGVGVVALSLAVLFDTLAKQAKGECLSDSGPIPGLFIKNQRGYYPPHIYTISEYLRLVPHIANNPTRMREETERYVEQLKLDDQSLAKLGENHTVALEEDTTTINLMLGPFFGGHLNLHLVRIKNGTSNEFIRADLRPIGNPIMNLNCNPETADKDFLAVVQKSDSYTQEALQRCTNKGDMSETWLRFVAKLEFVDVLSLPYIAIGNNTVDSMIAQREDFDLKIDALGKWDK